MDDDGDDDDGGGDGDMSKGIKCGNQSNFDCFAGSAAEIKQ